MIAITGVSVVKTDVIIAKTPRTLGEESSSLAIAVLTLIPSSLTRFVSS
jgi:hypothetical protein